MIKNQFLKFKSDYEYVLLTTQFDVDLIPQESLTQYTVKISLRESLIV